MKRSLLCTSLLVGCALQSLSPQERMRESVFQLNDASRWNQLEAAATWISPHYRTQFRERRSAWGEDVNVADIDITLMKLADDRETAISQISLSWTDASGVYLHRSNVTQTWANEHGSYRLVEEKIVKGDQGLFAEPTTSGDP